MIQELIVAVIGVVVLILVLKKLYTFFFVREERGKACGCSGCACSMTHKKA